MRGRETAHVEEPDGSRRKTIGNSLELLEIRVRELKETAQADFDAQCQELSTDNAKSMQLVEPGKAYADLRLIEQEQMIERLRVEKGELVQRLSKLKRPYRYGA